jgi:hypothetical protein
MRKGRRRPRSKTNGIDRRDVVARPGLTGHRKFRRLARALGSPLLARGALELLWDSCYESGEDYVGTSDDIENLVGWTGERGVLTASLVESGAPEGHGFLEPDGETAGAFRVHDLWHHAPEYVAKRRKRELDRQQKEDPLFVRDRRSAPIGDGSVGMPTCQIEVDGTPSPSPSHSPSPERKNGRLEDASDSQQAFLRYPTNGPVNAWTLTEAQVAKWAELYPRLDIRSEARMALAWIEANGGRRKTAGGMGRFLVNWLSRSNDKGGRGDRQPEPRRVFAPAFDCPHQPRCGGRNDCHVKTSLEAAKQKAGRA